MLQGVTMALLQVNINFSFLALHCGVLGQSDEVLGAVARQLGYDAHHPGYNFLLTKCLLGSSQTPLRPSLAPGMPAIKVQATEYSKPALHSVGPLRGAYLPVPEALTFLAATSVEAASAAGTPLPEDMLHPAAQGKLGPHHLRGSARTTPSRCAGTAPRAQDLQCATVAHLRWRHLQPLRQGR